MGRQIRGAEDGAVLGGRGRRERGGWGERCGVEGGRGEGAVEVCEMGCLGAEGAEEGMGLV